MARASAFQAEGRGFESRLPLHFFLFELGFPKIRMTGRMELRSPAPIYILPIRLFVPIRTWVPQDSNYGGPAPLQQSILFLFDYLFLFELGFPKIRMTGRVELRSSAPIYTLPIRLFVPIRTWVPQDSNDGQGGASLPCTNLHYPYFFLFELGFPKIRITAGLLPCTNVHSPYSITFSRFELGLPEIRAAEGLRILNHIPLIKLGSRRANDDQASFVAPQ